MTDGDRPADDDRPALSLGLLEVLAVAAAGGVAGAVNSVAGGGSLITFPTLVAVGVPPLAANVTNTVGLVPGAAGAMIAYREELDEQRGRLARMVVPTLLGSAAGAALLIATPGATFDVIVPGLVAASCLLLLFEPQLSRAIPHAGNERSPALYAGLALAGAYAAYFGSAVGILLLGVLALFVPDTLQRLNAIKITLAGAANLLSTLAYAFLAPVRWELVLVLAVSSLIGGRVGGHYSRRVSGDVLRVVIASAGLLVAVALAIRAF